MRILLFIALAIFCFGCDQSETVNVTNPPEPENPPPVSATNNSAVFAQGDGSCPAAGPCIGDFSVSINGGEKISWVFTGGQPPVSEVAAAQVRFTAPGSYNWTSSLTNNDGNVLPASGIVTFTAAP